MLRRPSDSYIGRIADPVVPLESFTYLSHSHPNLETDSAPKAVENEASSETSPAKRVAVLLDSEWCLSPVDDLVQSLRANPHADVAVFTRFRRDKNDSVGLGRQKSLFNGLWPHPSLYAAYLWLEMLLLSLFIGRLREFRTRKRLEVDSTGSGDASSSTGSAAPSVSSDTSAPAHPTEPFDLILDLRGGHIHPSSSENHVTLQFGDRSTNKFGPAGFWEMISGAGASGIQLKRGNTFLFHGRYKTKRLLSQNVESVYREGLFDVGTVLNRYLTTGQFDEMGDADPNSTSRPDSHPVRDGHISPSLINILHYLLLTLGREFSTAWKTKVLRKSQRFGVEVMQTDWKALASESSGAKSISIPNPAGHYYADPFLIEHGGQTICFVEDFEYARDKGRIAAIDLTSGTPVDLGPIIDEPFHMSFPFVFRHENELYMIPETFQDNRISVYKCLEFPLRWERHQTLMDNLEASDTMVFEHESRWWMLSNLRPEGCTDFYSKLYAFYADSPFSTEWTPHNANPILVDAEGGRNAGLLRDTLGNLHRVGQHQGMNIYGKACSVRKIKKLTPSEYQEEVVFHLTANAASTIANSPKLIGTHHIDASPHWTAFDTLKWERV